MALSSLPLSYCTNVHPATTAKEVAEGLDRYALPIAAKFGKPMSAGLWLAQSVVGEILGEQDGAARFAESLASRSLPCHTLNAFPFGNFHDARVKEKVYLPDWAKQERLDYTLQCAQVLAALLPSGIDGSISTLPLAFKPHAGHLLRFADAAADKLIECAGALARLYDQTGKRIRLAIEPEPFCLLETTAEAIQFFNRLRDRAAAAGVLDAVQTHVGLCYDICHQAVEFEDAGKSIMALTAAGIRINKVHISCALELDRPAANAAGKEALRAYVEPRYLHQTIGRAQSGRFARLVDLTDEAVRSPSAEFLEATMWRIHFHVPVDAAQLGPLNTTRDAIPEALAAVAALDYAPHLEVETYTWEVLPGARTDLVTGLARELIATDRLIADQLDRGHSPH